MSSFIRKRAFASLISLLGLVVMVTVGETHVHLPFFFYSSFFFFCV